MEGGCGGGGGGLAGVGLANGVGLEPEVADEVVAEGEDDVADGHAGLVDLVLRQPQLLLLPVLLEDGEGGDVVVELPQPVLGVEQVENAAEGEGVDEEHRRVAAPRLVRVL